MLVIKKGDYIYAKVDYEARDRFKKIVKGAVWDGTSRAWRIPATISTFKNLRQFEPTSMEPARLSPGIRAWYNELLAKARRLDELQRGIPDTACTGQRVPSGTSVISTTRETRGLLVKGRADEVAGRKTNVQTTESAGYGELARRRTTGEPVYTATVYSGAERPKSTGSGRERGPEEPDKRDSSGRERDGKPGRAGRVNTEHSGAENSGAEGSGKLGTVLDTTKVTKPVEFPADFHFHVEPFKHQREAIAFCINLKKSALWLDLGLGKTYTSINVARYRHQYNNVNKVLVVAPRSLLHQWKGELVKYAPGEAKTIIVEGTPSKKRQALDYVSSYTGLIFTIITYESISALRNEIVDAGFDMFILDEATKIKNPKAARTRATVEVCNTIEYGVELTGLAYLNNPVDLFSQFLALDGTVYGTDQWSFSEHYIDWVKAPFGRMMRGLRHVDELKRRAYFIAFSRAKKDCLDLPEKMYVTRTLPMYDTQKTWYDKLSAEVLEEAKQEITDVNVTNVLTKLEKLQQVTAGFVIKDDGETIWFDSPKYSEICDVVQESTESFIIWARHTEAIKRMSAALLQRNIASEELSRYTTAHRRNMAIKAFKEGKLRVLICQLQSESKGLDLTCATNSVNAIYLENTFSIDERWQSESRQHRIGMKGTATYIDLVLEDTVDEHILEILKGKFKISEYIAKMGLTLVLGKGGSIVTRKSRSKKKMPEPDDFTEFDDESLEGIEGFEDIVSIARKKRGAG